MEQSATWDEEYNQDWYVQELSADVSFTGALHQVISSKKTI